MKTSTQKLISRGLDRELDPQEREQLDAMLASNPDAARTSRIWELTGDQLRRDAAGIHVPDATVAWQDIRRAIRQDEPAPSIKAETGLGFRLRWAGALASLLVIGMVGLYALRVKQDSSRADHAGAMGPASRVEWVIAEIPGSTTMIYTDMETDLTVIWMDVAQSVDPRDT